MRTRFLEGKWAAYEGLVYQEYEEEKHLITREQAMDHLWALQRKNYRVKAIEGIRLRNIFSFVLSFWICG